MRKGGAQSWGQETEDGGNLFHRPPAGMAAIQGIGPYGPLRISAVSLCFRFLARTATSASLGLLQHQTIRRGLREFSFSRTHSPQYRPQNDVPLIDACMVSLQIHRAGAHNVGPKSPA